MSHITEKNEHKQINKTKTYTVYYSLTTVYISELDQKTQAKKREIKQKLNKSYTQLNRKKQKQNKQKISKDTSFDRSVGRGVVGCCVVARREAREMAGILFVEFAKVLRRLLTEKSGSRIGQHSTHIHTIREKERWRENHLKLPLKYDGNQKMCSYAKKCKFMKKYE